jgi:hypothetical protein
LFGIVDGDIDLFVSANFRLGVRDPSVLLLLDSTSTSMSRKLTSSQTTSSLLLLLLALPLDLFKLKFAFKRPSPASATSPSPIEVDTRERLFAFTAMLFSMKPGAFGIEVLIEDEYWLDTNEFGCP